MASAGRKWGMRLVKLGVVCIAAWYLSRIVTLNDYVRLAEKPSQRYLLLDETEQTLQIREPDSTEKREVPRSALALQTQLKPSQRPIEYGIKTILRRVEPLWALAALACFTPVTFIMAWRLRLMLSTQDIHLDWGDAVRLTFSGNFLNFFVPGTTGGDIYKAYQIAKRTHKRTEGITIVLLDRIIGLISFLLISAVAIMISWRVETDGSEPMIGKYGRWVGYLMIALFAGFCLFFSRHARRVTHYERIIEKLPMADKFRRMDRTAFGFRYFPGQSLLSLAGTLVAHLFFILSIYAWAHGLGIPHQRSDEQGVFFLACVLATVVGYLFAAIPISVQGFGLLEAVFLRVLVNGHWCNASEMVLITLGARLIQMLWALPGLATMSPGFRRPTSDDPDEAVAELEQADSDHEPPPA